MSSNAPHKNPLQLWLFLIAAFGLVLGLYWLFTYGLTGQHVWALFRVRTLTQQKQQLQTAQGDTNVVASSVDPYSDTGPLGDSYGALNTLFSGLAFAALIVTLVLQKRELEASLLEVRKSVEAQNELATAARIAKFYEVFDDDYLGRPLSRMSEVTSIHDLRARIRASCDDATGVPVESKYEEFVRRSTLPGTDECMYAENLGLQVQRLGFRILCGAVPLPPILSVYAVTILEDWSYCKRHVESIVRARAPLHFRVKQAALSDVDLTRRHGEWLGCMAAVYLHKRWAGDKVARLVGRVGNIDTLRSRSRSILEAERYSMFIDLRLRREVDLILELSDDTFDERMGRDETVA